MIRLIIVILLALSTPTSAEAYYPKPLRDAVKIASDRWPNSPCHGREKLQSIDPDSVPPDVAAQVTLDGTCTVQVAWQHMRGYKMRYRCRVLMHEFGHLAGLGHSYNILSVMYPIAMDIDTNSEKCWKRFP